MRVSVTLLKKHNMEVLLRIWESLKDTYLRKSQVCRNSEDNSYSVVNFFSTLLNSGILSKVYIFFFKKNIFGRPSTEKQSLLSQRKPCSVKRWPAILTVSITFFSCNLHFANIRPRRLPESQETPEITEMTKNFTKVTK